MGGFESLMKDHAMLFFFSPLIAAMAGNVGVQSSAIVVQALASEGLRGTMSQRLLKEVMLSLLNGSLLGGIVAFW